MEGRSGIQGFAEELQKAVLWLDSLGIRVSSTRFEQYLSLAEQIVGSPDLEARTDDPEFPKVLEALEAGGELHFIHKYLSSLRGPGFLRKLHDFAKGPYFQAAELPANSGNRARNSGFELYFGAQMARAGFDVQFDERADVEVMSPTMLVECKRPQSTKKVEYNLRKARRQLVRAPAGKSAVRVVALSVGKILENSGGLLYRGSAEQLDAAIDEDLKLFKSRNEHLWRQKSFDRIAGVWLHYVRVVVLLDPPTFARRAHDRIIDFGERGRREWSGGLNVICGEVIEDNGFDLF